jgi:hypothetical protein
MLKRITDNTALPSYFTADLSITETPEAFLYRKISEKEGDSHQIFPRYCPKWRQGVGGVSAALSGLIRPFFSVGGNELEPRPDLPRE